MKGQLSQKTLDKRARLAALDAKFPPARIRHSSEEWTVEIALAAGESYSLTVLIWGDPSPPQPPHAWREVWLPLDNAEDLALFIRALCARYNAIVDAANQAVAEIKLPRLELAPMPQPS